MKGGFRKVWLLGLLIILFGLALLAIFSPKPSSREILDKHIFKGIPEGTQVEELGYFNPTFGDGYLLVELRLTQAGKAELMARHNWQETDYQGAYMLRSLNQIEQEQMGKLLVVEKSEFQRIELFLKDQTTMILAASF